MPIAEPKALDPLDVRPASGAADDDPREECAPPWKWGEGESGGLEDAPGGATHPPIKNRRPVVDVVVMLVAFFLGALFGLILIRWGDPLSRCEDLDHLEGEQLLVLDDLDDDPGCYRCDRCGSRASLQLDDLRHSDGVLSCWGCALLVDWAVISWNRSEAP